jgi:uncharacterized RDD family membrane protein YckC
MRKINITTTQNVTIEYELATVMERALAALLDVVFILVGSLILYWIISSFVQFNIYFVIIPGSFFYHLLMESLNHGQSLGKKIFKIRVVKINGERPGFFDFMMRTAFRVIDISMTLGTLAMITVSSSEKGQRLGDFLADTTIIRLINVNSFSLGQLLSMDALKSYSPSYPEVIKFKEEEMLLIKETLERYKKYPNDSHIEALQQLVRKIEGQLNVVAPADKIQFLNTLIRDYVSLTR